MKILLTNDDGYQSLGIKALFNQLSQEHEVVIVAPDRERSGSSHAITLMKPIQFKEIGKSIFSCSGTPADTVLYSLLGVIDFRPDLVISGINRGPNLGTDLIFSGTAAAARQAALAGLPALAVSSKCLKTPFHFELEAKLLSQKLSFLMDSLAKRSFININFPKDLTMQAEWVYSFPSLRNYSDRLDVKTMPDGSKWCFLMGEPIGHHAESGSDWDLVLEGAIAWSVVGIDPFFINEKE